jgi:hypothetical protein
MLFAGMASAASSTDAQQTTSASVHQDVNIPTDNVLLALALDSSPRLSDVANIHRTASTSNSVSSSSNLGTNDVLLALALGNGGGSGFGARSLLLNSNGFGSGFNTFGSGFGTLGINDPFFSSSSLGVGDVSRSSSTQQTVDQSVSLNQDTVLAALALGHGNGISSFDTFGSGFGTSGFNTFGSGFGSGIGSIANVDRTVTQSSSRNSDTSLNSNDVLARLALGW